MHSQNTDILQLASHNHRLFPISERKKKKKKRVEAAMISFFRYNKAPKMLVLAFLGVASSSVKTCPSGQAEA